MSIMPSITCVKDTSVRKAKIYSSQEVAAQIAAERLAENPPPEPKKSKTDLRYLAWLNEQEKQREAEEIQRVLDSPDPLAEILKDLQKVEELPEKATLTWTKGEKPEAAPPLNVSCDLAQMAETICATNEYQRQLINKCYRQAGIDHDAYGLLDCQSPEDLFHQLIDLHFDSKEEAWEWDGTGWGLCRKHPNAPTLLRALEKHTSALSQHVHNLPLMKLDEEGIRDRARDLVNERLGRLAFAESVARATKPQAKADVEARRDWLPNPRYICEEAQRRRIRSERHRVDGHVSWILGLTGGNQQFITNATFRGWEQRQENAKAWASDKAITTLEGEFVAKLSDVMATSKSARRATLIALTLGLTDKAKKLGLAPVFITLTLPTQYHPNPKKGRCSYDPSISPKDAFNEMQERWGRVRALFSKRGIDFFGIWTAEPHEDGCPHRHGLIWLPIGQLNDLKSAIKKHFPGKRATKIKVLKGDGEATAKVSSYVLTYVLKATDAAGKPEKEVDEDHLENFRRMQGWASANAARRFGFIGLPKGLIGTWRGIYNMADENITDPRIRLIKKRMRKRQYASALTLLGAFDKVETSDQRFQPVYRERQNKYREIYKQKIGIKNVFTGYYSLWKTKDYVITDNDRSHKVSFVVSSPRESADASSTSPKSQWKPPPDGIWHTEEDGTAYRINPETGEVL